MFPILIQIGPLTIYSLWIFIAIGFFISLLVLTRLIKKSRLKIQFIADNSLIIFFTGLIAARLLFVIRDYKFYFIPFSPENFLQVFYIWDKGLSIWGGIIGTATSLAILSYRAGENTKRWMDVICVSIIIAFVFGNIGTFLDGKNYGNETNLPWGVIMENSIYAVPIHPAQIYASIYCLILFISLYLLFGKNIGKKDGNIAIIGMSCYSLLRFLDEFMRGDETNFILGLREGQIYALLGIVTGVILFFVNNRPNTITKTNHENTV